jgi:hypothetical protein
MNNECYHLNIINFNKGLLDNSVDATYVIHLKNNGRIDNIINQLNLFKPTKINYILFNDGYKNCKKEEYIKSPPLDLVDAFINVFKHAEQQNYNNILVLEDDFFFSEEIRNTNVLNNINSFLNKA